MGYQFLESLVEQKGLYRKVRIEDVVRDGIRQEGKKPLVVVDGNNLPRFLYQGDYLRGGQWRDYFDRLHTFVQKFRDIGVELVVFTNTLCSEYVKAYNKVEQTESLLKRLGRGTPELKRGRADRPMSCRRLTTLALHHLNLGCKVLKACGSVNSDGVVYAYSHDAVAILGQHTLYLLDDLPCKYLSLKHFNLENMTTFWYDPELLAEYAGINPHHLRYIAPLLERNDYSATGSFENFRTELFFQRWPQLRGTTAQLTIFQWLRPMARVVNDIIQEYQQRQDHHATAKRNPRKEECPRATELDVDSADRLLPVSDRVGHEVEEAARRKALASFVFDTLKQRYAPTLTDEERLNYLARSCMSAAKHPSYDECVDQDLSALLSFEDVQAVMFRKQPSSENDATGNGEERCVTFVRRTSPIEESVSHDTGLETGEGSSVQSGVSSSDQNGTVTNSEKADDALGSNDHRSTAPSSEKADSQRGTAASPGETENIVGSNGQKPVSCSSTEHDTSGNENACTGPGLIHFLFTKSFAAKDSPIKLIRKVTKESDDGSVTVESVTTTIDFDLVLEIWRRCESGEDTKFIMARLRGCRLVGHKYALDAVNTLEGHFPCSPLAVYLQLVRRLITIVLTVQTGKKVDGIPFYDVWDTSLYTYNEDGSVEEYDSPEMTLTPIETEELALPSLRQLWLGGGDQETQLALRWRTLAQLVDPALSAGRLRQLPARLVVPTAVLRHLATVSRQRQRPLTAAELLALVLTAVAPCFSYHQFFQPPRLTSRVVYVTNLFMRGVCLLLDALSVCNWPISGADALPQRYFDGQLYHCTLATLDPPTAERIVKRTHPPADGAQAATCEAEREVWLSQLTRQLDSDWDRCQQRDEERPSALARQMLEIIAW